MKLEEAKELMDLFVKNIGLENVKVFELKDACKTILQEIEHLQKENEELQKENGKLTRARKWFIEHTIGQIATPEMLDKILEDKYISKDKLIETIDFGVQATNVNDDYSIGMCNGMLYIKSVILDKDIEYKKRQNKEKKNTYEYGLVVGTKREREHWKDKIRGKIEELTDKYNRIYKFPSPKVEETPEDKLIYSIRFNTDSEALRIVKVILEELLGGE